MDKLVEALRELVAVIYNDCIGAYGSDDGTGYEGQYEREIQALAKAIIEAIKKGKS